MGEGGKEGGRGMRRGNGRFREGWSVFPEHMQKQQHLSGAPPRLLAG